MRDADGWLHLHLLGHAPAFLGPSGSDTMMPPGPARQRPQLQLSQPHAHSPAAGTPGPQLSPAPAPALPGAPSPGVGAGPPQFTSPKYYGVALSYCLDFDTNCGQPAADFFCQEVGPTSSCPLPPARQLCCVGSVRRHRRRQQLVLCPQLPPQPRPAHPTTSPALAASNPHSGAC